MGVFSWWPRSHQEIFDDLNKQKKEEMEQVEKAPEPERMIYTIGPSTNGRVMMKIPYGEFSMNAVGIDALINVLEASKRWIDERDTGCQDEDEPV